jgi:hypothetical protein
MPVNSGAVSERALFSEIFEREFESWRRRLSSFPVDHADDRLTDCPCTARELAARLLERQRTLLDIVGGSGARIAPGRGASPSEMLGLYESAHAETRRMLAALSDTQWQETIASPVGLVLWERARRGELLWLGLKDLIRQGAHFGVHLRVARDATPQLASH